MRSHPSGGSNRRYLRPIPDYGATLFDAPDAVLPRSNTMLGVPSKGGRAGNWYRREILPWAGLVHENLATVYEVVDHPTGVYEIRQQFTGVRLQKFLDDGHRLGPREVRHLLEGLVAALGHAHDLGLAHGQLTPEVIELTPRGGVLLHRLSPGIVNAWAGHNAPAARLRPYRAPEQVRGEVASRESDIFALSVIVYQLISAALPFPSHDLGALEAEILGADPRPLTVRAGFPAHAFEVLRRGLAKQPSDRFVSAAELLKALFVESPLRYRDRARARDQHQAALLWMRLPRQQPALECWLEARWLCPGLARMDSNIGVALAGTGRLSEAEAFFASACEFAPDDELLRMHLGWARWKQGKGEAPIDHLFADPDDDLGVSFDGEFEPKVFEIDESEFFRKVGPVWPGV